jgi:4a-hydroxytetrahydrobiopterin dehydratase
MEHQNKWVHENNSLVKIYTFNDFIEAINFVNKIVPLAEKMNHHPDIEIFSYNKVKVKLSTHEQGGKITQKDIKLSLEIEKIN